jgi:Tfp pilus assembly protein PilX
MRAPALRAGPRSVRSGFALVAALLAVVLIGALVAGAMFATAEETRVGTTGIARDIALMAAESALSAAVTSGGVALPNSVGVAGAKSQTTEISGRRVTLYSTRLDSTTYWFVAQCAADASHSGAQRRVGILVRAQRKADSSISIMPISERAWSELF